MENKLRIILTVFLIISVLLILLLGYGMINTSVSIEYETTSGSPLNLCYNNAIYKSLFFIIYIVISCILLSFKIRYK